MNIPVRLPYCDVYSPATDYLTEAKTLRPGLHLARTLLPESQTAAICAINVSGKDQRLKDGLFLGQAVPGMCTSDSIVVDVLSKQNQRGDVTEGSRVLVVTGSQGNSPVPAHSAVEPHAECDEQDSNFSHQMENGVPTAVCEETLAEAGTGRIVDTVMNMSDDSDTTDTTDFSALTNETLLSLFEGEFSYLEPIVASLPTDFSVAKRRKICELLLRNHAAFSKNEYDVGCTNLMYQKINTGNNEPIAEPLRRHPRAHLELIDDTIAQLLRADIIEPASSAWAANIVLVRKKDSDLLRVCVDFR